MRNSLEQIKILIIRLSSLGDVLLTSPLLKSLRKKYPNGQIDFVVKSQFIDLLAHNPNINHIYSYNSKEGIKGLRALKKKIREVGYDLVFDLHRNFRSVYLRNLQPKAKILKYHKYIFKRLLLIYFRINLYNKKVPVYQRYLKAAEPLAIPESGFNLELFIPKDVENKIRNKLMFLGWQPNKLTVGIAAGAGYFTKRWLPDRFAQVADSLMITLGAQILLLGGHREQEINAKVVNYMHGRPYYLKEIQNIKETAAAMKQCSLVICNDSGLMHMTQALDKKIIAIFGSTTEELGFFPQGDKARIVQKDIPCRPCTHVGRNYCPKGHFLCMNSISAQEVAEIALNFYKSSNTVCNRVLLS